jgi:hypothetical protein
VAAGMILVDRPRCLKRRVCGNVSLARAIRGSGRQWRTDPDIRWHPAAA